MATSRQRSTARLLPRICRIDALVKAYSRVATGTGAPGVDGVTPRTFGRHLHTNLQELSEQLRDGSYAPSPLRGHERNDLGKRRVFGLATVRDRVAQRSTLDNLAPTLDARQSSASFAYRKGHHWLGALRRVEQLRDMGHPWVYRFDIREFFEQIDHAVLSDQLATVIADERVRKLLMAWAATPTISPTGQHARRRGLPLGIPVSAALANHHLAAFDQLVQHDGRSLVRYADDGVVACRSQAEAVEAERVVGSGLAMLGLEPNATKSEVASFASGFVFLGWRFVGSGGFPDEDNRNWVHPMSYERPRRFSPTGQDSNRAVAGHEAPSRFTPVETGVTPRFSARGQGT